jgi:hypothetical protein
MPVAEHDISKRVSEIPRQREFVKIEHIYRTRNYANVSYKLFKLRIKLEGNIKKGRNIN